MSYYEPQGWQAPRQTSWEQPPPPSRSGTSSVSQREADPIAFTSQLEEVERAIDNLVKSGKLLNPASRRDSMPMMMGRGYSEFDPRMGAPPRHHSVSEFEPIRSPVAGAGMQNFYANQRYQSRSGGGGGGENEQMMQNKRRMAAQRERELRNYHQEQQYNRSVLADMSSNKSDRSLSPAAMSEEGRRELIARQHRALWGSENPYPGSEGSAGDNKNAPRPEGHSPAGTGPRGGSPFAPGDLSQSQSTSGQPRSRSNSVSSPNSGTNPSSFGLIDTSAQRSSQTSTSSPSGDSPSHQTGNKSNAPIGSGMGPIGSRGAHQQPQNHPLNKRSTTPLPSPLSYSFHQGENAHNERSNSAASNPAGKEGNPGLAWGSSSGGVWGSKSSLGVQASVWG